MRLAVASVAIWLGLHSTAFACSYPPPEFLEIQADEDDQEAPLPPPAKVERIKRGKEPERDGCSFESSSCDDVGYLLIDLGASDSGEPSELGYLVEVTGKHPAALDGLAQRPLLASRFDPGKLRLVWTDGEGHENYDFDVYLWAVDRAGNMSESPTKLHVENEGSDGCAALASRGRGGALLPLLLALWLWRGRRRPSIRPS